MMNRYIILWLLASAVCSRQCFNNSYMQERQSFTEPLKLLRRPVFRNDAVEFFGAYSTPSCLKEWLKHGACCDTSNLIRHAQEDHKEIVEASDILVDLHKSLQNVTHKFYNAILKLSVFPLYSEKRRMYEPHYTSWAISMNKIFKAAKRFLEDPKNLNYLDLSLDGYGSWQNLNQDDDYFKRENQKFKKASEECWETISRLRNASICSLCSARSKEFFIGEKGLSKIEYCSDALHSCYRVLKITSRMVKVIHWVFTEKQVFKDTGVSIEFKGQVTDISMIGEYKIRRGFFLNAPTQKKAKESFAKFSQEFFEEKGSVPSLADRIQELDESHDFNLPETNSAICDKFLNLAKKPFIIPLANAFYSQRNFMSYNRFMNHAKGEILFEIEINYHTQTLLNWQLPNNLENQRKKSKAEQHEKLKHFRTNRREKKETKKAKAKKLAISSNWNRRLQSYPFGWGPFDQEEAFMSSDLTYLELMNMGIQMGDIVTDAIYTRKPMNLSLLFP